MSEGLLKNHVHPSVSFVAQSKVTLANWAQLCFMPLNAQQEEEEGAGGGRFSCGHLFAIGLTLFLVQISFPLILKICWTHTWAGFSVDVWRQQAEPRPLIFLPGEFLAPSADTVAEAQVSKLSQQFSSDQINRTLWLEHFGTSRMHILL